jgi:hypothetical protein
MLERASRQGGRDYQRQDLRHDYRDLSGDYARVNAMRADIARDRTRLNEDIRCGREAAAARDATDLARDQRALEAQLRDIRHDQREFTVTSRAISAGGNCRGDRSNKQ